LSKRSAIGGQPSGKKKTDSLGDQKSSPNKKEKTNGRKAES
jgi:hypothetical protein